MSTFNWISAIDALSEPALTVQAQTINAADVPDNLIYERFFPRENVDSVDLRDVTTLDYRPVADRREWNARGRLIPNKTPDIRNVSIVPIESYFKWGEYEMQRMAENTMGNQSVLQQIMETSIPGKLNQLVEANYRRIEIDAFAAWTTGTITQKNPQTGETFAASLNYDSGRYLTAPTAWNDGGVNAYDLFVAFLQSASEAIGPVAGVMLRQATYNAIAADAPREISTITANRRQIETMIQDTIGNDFTFVINEQTLEPFNDGGTATTSTKVFPAQRVAAIPAGGRVGRTAFAPVVRAMELARQVPGAGIDVRGMTAYYDKGLMGRELELEVQVNALPLPSEQRIYVINSGV